MRKINAPFVSLILRDNPLIEGTRNLSQIPGIYKFFGGSVDKLILWILVGIVFVIIVCLLVYLTSKHCEKDSVRSNCEQK